MKHVAAHTHHLTSTVYFRPESDSCADLCPNEWHRVSLQNGENTKQEKETQMGSDWRMIFAFKRAVSALFVWSLLNVIHVTGIRKWLSNLMMSTIGHASCLRSRVYNQ